MRYVDDLGKVKPEEIQHIGGARVSEIGINPKIGVTYPFKVIFEVGSFSTYTKAGRNIIGEKQCFIYKEAPVQYFMQITNQGWAIFKLIDNKAGAAPLASGLSAEAAEILVNSLNEGKIKF